MFKFVFLLIAFSIFLFFSLFLLIYYFYSVFVDGFSFSSDFIIVIFCLLFIILSVYGIIWLFTDCPFLCPNCSILVDTHFCPDCGYDLFPVFNCPNCFYEYSLDHFPSYCIDCGFPLR